jgi:hypothetical protein
MKHAPSFVDESALVSAAMTIIADDISADMLINAVAIVGDTHACRIFRGFIAACPRTLRA